MAKATKETNRLDKHNHVNRTSTGSLVKGIENVRKFVSNTLVEINRLRQFHLS